MPKQATPKKDKKAKKKKKQPAEKKQAVVVKGWIIDAHLPSKDCLKAIIPRLYKGEDVGKQHIEPLKGIFMNRLGNISGNFYEERKAMTIKIAPRIVLLPAENLERFLDLDRRTLEALQEHEDIVREFLTTGEIPEAVKSNQRATYDLKHFELAKECLKAEGYSFNPKVDIVSRYKVDRLPFVLDWAILEEHLNVETTERIDSERKRGEQVARKEFESVKSETLSYLDQEFDSRAAEWEEHANTVLTKKVTELRLNKLANELESLQKLALTPKASKRVEALKRLVEKPEKYVDGIDVERCKSVRAAAMARKLKEEKTSVVTREKKQDIKKSGGKSRAEAVKKKLKRNGKK